MHPLLKTGIAIVSSLYPIGLTIWDTKRNDKAFMSDRLYVGYMNGEFTQAEVKRLCRKHKIKYPPIPLHTIAINKPETLKDKP
jgi:hypothetical protein